ncbi:MAG: hypothetical protein ABIQ16_22415 [Polyangiaceae bacterium]
MTTFSDLSCFGLRSSPFNKEIEDAELWLPESKIALVTDIEEALTDRDLLAQSEAFQTRAAPVRVAWHLVHAVTAPPAR